MIIEEDGIILNRFRGRRGPGITSPNQSGGHNPGGTSRFVFNGTDGTPSAQSTYQTDAATPGAITAEFQTPLVDTNRDIFGTNQTWVRVRVTNEDLRVQLHGDAGNFVPLTVALNVPHLVILDWPGGGADGKINLDGFSIAKPAGVTTSVNALRLGRANALNAAWVGPVWNVKVYSDESLTTLIHHWPMNEGSGNVFFDIVGGDDITFDAAIGAWE